MPIPGSTFTDMLLTRDADWKERLKLMQNIMANLGVNPNYDDLLNNPQHFSDLIMGWLAQMLDTQEEVSSFAIKELIKLIKMNPSVALIHLNDIVDTIFSILNNNKHSNNHKLARTALIEIIDFIIETQNACYGLQLTDILSKYLDIEYSIDAKARGFALYCIKRVLMKENATKMDKLAMPTLPAPQREWLNMAIKKSVGPTLKLMTQGDKYNESLKQNSTGNNNENKAQESENEIKSDLAKLSGNDSNTKVNLKLSGKQSSKKKNKDGKDKDNDKMSSREIGKEFFDVILHAVETGLMDPNRDNRNEAARLAQLLDEMSGNDIKYIGLLNGDAKKRYYQSNVKRKRSSREMPSKPLPLALVNSNSAGTTHHDISQKVGVSIRKPDLPNI